MSGCQFGPKKCGIVRLTQRPQRGWERKGIFFRRMRSMGKLYSSRAFQLRAIPYADIRRNVGTHGSCVRDCQRSPDTENAHLLSDRPINA